MVRGCCWIRFGRWLLFLRLGFFHSYDFSPLHVFCILQSEIYELIDAIFYDQAVTGKKNDKWGNYSNRLTIETDATGTLLTGYASSNGYYIANSEDAFSFSDYTCEFDVVSISGGVRWYHQHETLGNENVFVLNTYVSDGNHVKIVVKNGTAILYVDNVQRATYTLTISSLYEVAFRFNTGVNNTIKYKNFILY